MATKPKNKKSKGAPPRKKPARPAPVPKTPPVLAAANAVFDSVAQSIALAVIGQLIVEAEGQPEVVIFLEAAYQKVEAGGGSDGGKSPKEIPPDLESTE